MRDDLDVPLDDASTSLDDTGVRAVDPTISLLFGVGLVSGYDLLALDSISVQGDSKSPIKEGSSISFQSFYIVPSPHTQTKQFFTNFSLPKDKQRHD